MYAYSVISEKILDTKVSMKLGLWGFVSNYICETVQSIIGFKYTIVLKLIQLSLILAFP